MESRNKKLFALLMGMGTGKSKIIVDTAAWNYAKGRITALVVIAPNGVHTNWIVNEVPAHMPDWVPHVTGYWRSGFKAKEKKAWNKMWDNKVEGLRVFTFNVEAFSSPKGKAELRKILNAFNCLLAIDESHRIKTPGAKRTKSLLALGKHAIMKRILTGTLLTNSPLDSYSQFRFLSENIIGFNTFAGFKSHFSIIEKMTAWNKVKGEEQEYDHVVAYRNIPEMVKSIKPYTFFVRKEDCLDLPDKIFENIYVDLSTEQKRMYDQLVLDGIAKIREQNPDTEVPEFSSPDEELWWFIQQSMGETAGIVKSENTLTTLLRLQQIIGGWVTDDLGEIHELKSNRLKTLMDTVSGIEGSMIIWARFKPEMFAIAKALRKEYGDDSVVEYHGSVDVADRADNVKKFQNKSARFFVGNTHSGGIGLTLTAATTMIYYSNDFSYEARAQSEDRAHRIGQKENVLYIDLIAMGTVDDKIVKALKAKEKMANEFNDMLEGLSPEELEKRKAEDAALFDDMRKPKELGDPTNMLLPPPDDGRDYKEFEA